MITKPMIVNQGLHVVKTAPFGTMLARLTEGRLCVGKQISTGKAMRSRSSHRGYTHISPFSVMIQKNRFLCRRPLAKPGKPA